MLLIPGTQYAVTGSKEGKLYVLNTQNMGHMVAGNTQIPQLFKASAGGHIHGSPVYWNGPTGPLVYMWAEEDFLKAFGFDGQSFNTTPVTKSTFAAPPGMPGGFLSLSANGSCQRDWDPVGVDAAVAGRRAAGGAWGACALSMRPT